MVRINISSNNENQEKESYSYLRHSCGPQQGFFWDIYGDDMQSVELAVLALHQAPYPTYSGPIIYKMNLKPKGDK